MPYRRLPTTDKARVRALNAALELNEKRHTEDLAFSKGTLLELKQVKTMFEGTLQIYKTDVRRQSERNREYKISMEKASLYVSHFIQSLYMAVEREEIKEDALNFYDLGALAGKMPSLNTEEEIFKWGAKVVEGEQKRIQKGGSPIYSPSIALVKIKLEDFKNASFYMHNTRKIAARSYEMIKKHRVSTNRFICKMWNEIEENIKTENPKHKEQIAMDYGIVYILRRREKNKLDKSISYSIYKGNI